MMPRDSRLPTLFTAVVALIIAAAVISWSTLEHAFDERRAVDTRMQQSLSRQAEISAQTLDMLFQAVDLGLGDIGENIRNRIFSDAYNPQHFHDALRRKLTNLPQVARLLVFDEDGVTESDSIAHPPRARPITGTPLLQAHRDQWLEFRIWGPGHGVPGLPEDSVLVSRRVDDSGGAFRGVVVAELDAPYLREALVVLHGTAQGVALIDHRGTVVAAHLADLSRPPPIAGSLLEDTPPFLPPSSQDTHPGLYDRPHMQAKRQLAHLPLRVAVIGDHAADLGAWRANHLLPALGITAGIGVAALALIAILIAQAHAGTRASRQLRDSEARYRSIVQDHSELICRTGPDLRLSFVNEAFCRYYGRPMDDLIGRDYLDLVPAEHHAFIREKHAALTPDTPTVSYEHSVRVGDGDMRWQRWTDRALYGADGTLYEYQSFGWDVTERRRAEDALEDALARIDKTARSVPGMIFQYRLAADGADCFPYCSDGVRDVLGLEPATLAADGAPAFAMVHPDDLDRVHQSVQTSADTLAEWDCELRILHPQKGEIWVLGHANPERQLDGSVLWSGYLSDITSRKHTQQALLASEQRLGLIMRGTNDAPWDWDVTTDNVYYAPRWWDMLGLAPGSLPATIGTWRDRLHPEDAKHMAGYIEETFNDPEITNIEVEFRLRHARGHHVPMLCRGVILRGPDGQPTRVSGANTDLSERRALEQALAESEHLYRSIFEHVSDSIFLVEPLPDGQFRYLRNNPAHATATGLSSLAEARLDDLLPPDTAGQVAERYTHCVNQGHAISYEETLDLPGGTRTWSTMLSPIRGEDGRVTLLIGVSRDITETNRLQALTRENQERLASYFRVAPLGIYVTDSQGTYTEVNPAAWAQSGFTEADLLKMSVFDLVLPEDRDVATALVNRTIEYGAAADEMRLRRKDGTWFWAMIVAGALPSDGQMIGFVEDISERKRMEESLQRSNADLEQFAYVASHDLRQPLRMVNSYLQLVTRRLGDDLPSDIDEFIGYARDGALRMDQMLVALLEYSRVGRVGQPMAPVDSRAMLEEALLFLGPAIEECGARVEVSGTWPELVASRDELVRLFQNLIGNALKYRPPETNPRITVAAEEVADGWRFSVTDNGIGIATDQVKRLFKVFQRLHTRDEYEGTGIGLAVCRKIVERHDGRIWVESQGHGRGTTFTFVLPPRPTEAQDRAPSAKPVPAEPA